MAKFCGCCDNIPMCCFLMCVPGSICYLNIYISAQAQNNLCVPCVMVICFGCYGVAFNRKKIREHYQIKGSYCLDYLVWCSYPLCASLQEYRESIERAKLEHKQRRFGGNPSIEYHQQRNSNSGLPLHQIRNQ